MPGLPLVARRSRGDNARTGDSKSRAHRGQCRAAEIFRRCRHQSRAADVQESNKPFVLVFWSRDPDGTQHNQGDSLLKVEPGINGPTSLAAVKNADDNWRNCAPCSMNLDFRQTPISSSPPTTASRRYRRRAKPAAPPGHFIRACRRAIYRPGFSPSTSPMHWRCLCTIRTRKIPRSLPGCACGAAMADRPDPAEA